MGWVRAPRRGYLYTYGRKVVVAVVGTTIIVFGLAIAWLPGPGPLVLVPLGLSVLAIEFAWAKRMKREVRVEAKTAAARVRARMRARRGPRYVPPHHPTFSSRTDKP